VAVLPFTDLSPDGKDEYFSDGITEELINALSKVDGLRVAARTSAFAFKGKAADMREIGEQLQVGTVLEGSVRRAGKRLRITAQLVSVADGFHLWSEDYDSELGDVFSVQEEVASAIVRELQVKLINQQDRFVKRATADPQAHDLYLLGRSFWNQRAPSTLLTAVRYFERAIEKDSAYAEAYAGLADAYLVLPSYAVTSPRDAYPKAKAAAMQALALDSTLGQARVVLASVRENYDWDWQGAEQDFRRALALTPNYATAHQRYAQFLNTVGRGAEALAEIDRALALDPLSRIVVATRGLLLYYSRRYDESISQLRETVDLNPDFSAAHRVLGLSYLAKGMHAKAVAELETAARLSQPSGFLAYAYALSGRRDRALAIVRELEGRSQREYVSMYGLAIAHIGLGDREQAFAWLGRATDARDPEATASVLTDPFLDSVRSDPRFSQLLMRMGLR